MFAMTELMKSLFNLGDNAHYPIILTHRDQLCGGQSLLLDSLIHERQQEIETAQDIGVELLINYLPWDVWFILRAFTLLQAVSYILSIFS